MATRRGSWLGLRAAFTAYLGPGLQGHVGLGIGATTEPRERGRWPPRRRGNAHAVDGRPLPAARHTAINPTMVGWPGRWRFSEDGGNGGNAGERKGAARGRVVDGLHNLLAS